MNWFLAICIAFLTGVLLWTSDTRISRARTTVQEKVLDEYDLELQAMKRSFRSLQLIEIDVAAGRISLEEATNRIEAFFAIGRLNCSIEQFRGRDDRERLARMICGWMNMTIEIDCPHYRDLTVARLHAEFEELFPGEEALPYYRLR